MPKKQSKHKRNKRKHTQIKRFKSATIRLREKRLLAVEQDAESRYQYHQLRLLLNKKALLPIC